MPIDHLSFTQRKIMSPPLPSPMLHREALVTQLTSALSTQEESPSPYRLLLCCAPAGYGKTTLLVDFIQHADMPGC